ncbi:alanine:cation symporter family protein, partial [Moraxella catarrhalis]|uniref:alanine:cation symporter family protein n=1 Tax=Moraxella catarrhalis TaxID=480 RepID=UPI001D0D99F0
AISFIITCGLFLPGVQSNGGVKAITGITGEGTMVNTAFGAVGANTLVVSLVMVLILGLIIFGGIKRIARVAEFVVPLMALGYILMAVLIVLFNSNQLTNIMSLSAAASVTSKARMRAAGGRGE